MGAPQLFRTISPTIQHAASRRVSGPPPSLLSLEDGMVRVGVSDGTARTQEPRSLPSAVASLPPGLFCWLQPKGGKPRIGLDASLCLSQESSLALQFRGF